MKIAKDWGHLVLTNKSRYASSFHCRVPYGITRPRSLLRCSSMSNTGIILVVGYDSRKGDWGAGWSSLVLTSSISFKVGSRSRMVERQVKVPLRVNNELHLFLVRSWRLYGMVYCNYQHVAYCDKGYNSCLLFINMSIMEISVVQ